jgi:hypothetical protein
MVGLVTACGAGDAAAKRGDVFFELSTGVAFVADDRFAAVERSREQGKRDFPLGSVGGDECCRPWCPVRSAGEMQAAAPEPAGMTTRVAVPADIGEL